MIGYYFFASITLIAILVLDTSISNIADTFNITKQIPVFIFISIVFIISQYVILFDVRRKSKNTRILNSSVTIVQSISTAGFIILLFEIITRSGYHTTILVYFSTVSYGLGLSIMGLLSYKFFSWYSRNRAEGGNSHLLLYGIATAITSLAILSTITFYDLLIIDKPVITTPTTPVIFQQVYSESPLGILKTTYSLSSLFAFLFLWFSTGKLLSIYSQKVRGKSIFWSLMSVPLVYYLSQYILLLEPNNSLLITVYSLWGLIVGILFALPFFVMAAKNRSIIRGYLGITGFGFILVFVSGAATVAHAPYPPFGLASVLCTGLSSCLVFAGLYNSAVVISYDSKLRQSIRKLAMQKSSELLDSIGTGQMEEQIEKTVLEIRKEQNETLRSDRGIDSDAGEEDVKKYLEEAMEEVKRMRKER